MNEQKKSLEEKKKHFCEDVQPVGENCNMNGFVSLFIYTRITFKIYIKKRNPQKVRITTILAFQKKKNPYRFEKKKNYFL